MNDPIYVDLCVERFRSQLSQLEILPDTGWSVDDRG